MAASVSLASGMTMIMLSGSLARKFGRKHTRQIDSGTSREVFKALSCTIDGFEQEIKRLASLGLRFAVFRNRINVGESELDLGGTRELRIVPVIGGSKRGGALQTIVGVVLLAISWAFPVTAPYLTPAGIGLVAGGVIQMLSPQASGLKQSASPENLPSYAFGSAKNTTASGNPVPICIGERRWGGMIISASIYAEDKT
ncbi:tail assembly protein [Pseudomonas chlororaphis]|uniref:tail assembly protein n=1 Tax=Pseudomonas chlororaphis TaxID=587753 RepID=UPI002365268A|nr:tail assembly protein [Pseudomonas chlororaphis]WDH25123.1 tail assembly protein [Pseudomonas chlororaphis]